MGFGKFAPYLGIAFVVEHAFNVAGLQVPKLQVSFERHRFIGAVEW